ncbi:MAG: hypothetical protein JW929_08150 [Anaerolineales bacterium]|nr:hypothetical protein [Anaerolineales bacterium]
MTNIVNFDNFHSFRGGAKEEFIRSAVWIAPGGRMVKARIELFAIRPEEGPRIGLEFHVNHDEDGDGRRDSVAIWHDPSSHPF